MAMMFRKPGSRRTPGGGAVLDPKISPIYPDFYRFLTIAIPVSVSLFA
jgi:hypothetical protein